MNSEEHGSFQKLTAKFIDYNLNEYRDHDDLVCLISLGRKLDAELQESVLPNIKSLVEEFWKEEIDQNVASEGVLEGYTDPEEEIDAFNKIFEYLSDKLFYFDYSEDEISRISEFADIQGQIEANQESLIHGEEDYETWRGSGDESPQNDYALVHDLFQRE